MADIEFKFYKDYEGVEKIVKEKKIPTMTDEELAEEVADVVLRGSEYKQVVAWWNPIETPEKPPGWNCTFRAPFIHLSQTCDYKAIKHKEIPLCLSFEYRNKECWVMEVVKEDKKYRERIEGVKIMIREALKAKEKEMKQKNHG